MRSSTIRTFCPSRAAGRLPKYSGSLAMLATICALRHICLGVSVPTPPGRWERVPNVSVTETRKPALHTRLRNALPLVGLGVAVIVNAAWVGLLGYFVFRLV